MVEPTTKQQDKKHTNTLLIISVLLIIGGGVFVFTQVMQLMIIENVSKLCQESLIFGNLISEKNQLACSYIADEKLNRQILFSFALGILIFGVILITFAIHKRKQ